MATNNITTLKPHISLNVKDITASVKFYQKLFGIEPMKFIESSSNEDGSPVRTGYAKFDVQNPPLNLALNEASFAEGGSLSHLGIQVGSTDDVLKTRERWISEGLATADEMNVDCCYALQDKTWARDPDGNEWEVFTVLENTQPAGEACACGSKVESRPEAEQISAAVCCGGELNPNNITSSKTACC